MDDYNKYFPFPLTGQREHIIIGYLLLVTQNNYIVNLVNGDVVV